LTNTSFDIIIYSLENLEMAFGKVLDISTIHVNPEDLQILEDNQEDLFSVFGKSEFGCILSVGCDEYLEEQLGDFRELGLSELFINVYKFAIKHDCMFINFDADAENTPELQTSEEWT
jgi:hypothetical protein